MTYAGIQINMQPDIRRYREGIDGFNKTIKFDTLMKEI
jgi:hypothetical protein